MTNSKLPDNHVWIVMQGHNVIGAFTTDASLNLYLQRRGGYYTRKCTKFSVPIDML